MKELNHCSECDKKLDTLEKDMNQDRDVNAEEWLCFDCESENRK